jgi:hypothetical protein
MNGKMRWLALIAAPIGLLLIGACAGPISTNQAAPTTTCSTPATAPTPNPKTPVYGVLVGSTANLAKTASSADAQAFANVVTAGKANGARLIVDRLGSGVATANLAVNEQLTANGTNDLFRKRDLTCKSQLAASGFAHLDETTPTAKPDVFGALNTMSGHLTGLPGSEIDVVILGSLLNASAVDLTNPTILSNPAAAVQAAKSRGLIPDCRGWHVYAVGGSLTSQGGLDDQRNIELREFYRQLFASCGLHHKLRSARRHPEPDIDPGGAPRRAALRHRPRHPAQRGCSGASAIADACGCSLEQSRRSHGLRRRTGHAGL